MTPKASETLALPTQRLDALTGLRWWAAFMVFLFHIRVFAPLPGSINAVFDQHIAHVEERIRELMQLKEQLSGLRKRCMTEQTVNDCGILQGLAAMENEAKHERHTHLG